MSDDSYDNEEDEGQRFMMTPFGAVMLPSQAEMKKQKDMSAMYFNSQQARQRDFIKGLTSEQVLVLRSMLLHGADDRDYILHLAGTMWALAVEKFDTCFCAETVTLGDHTVASHAEALLKETSQEYGIPDTKPVKAFFTPEPEFNPAADAIFDKAVPPDNPELGSIAYCIQNWRKIHYDSLKQWDQLCETYNIKFESQDPGDGDPYQYRFSCKTCDLDYVSLDDRMIEQPGEAGCQGCVHNARWGGTQIK